MKKKMYLSAPLPFVGQKRMFAREFIKVLKQFPDDVTFVDLFGGSGLLSHIAKRCKPNATVVYNDFDNYRKRLENIPRTNRLIADIREIVGNTVPRHKAITGDIRERIFDRIQREEGENGYVDFITLSASIMFSMKYKLSVAEMRKDTLYNNIRKTIIRNVSTIWKGWKLPLGTIERCSMSTRIRPVRCFWSTRLISPPKWVPIRCTGSSPITSTC